MTFIGKHKNQTVEMCPTYTNANFVNHFWQRNKLIFFKMGQNSWRIQEFSEMLFSIKMNKNA